MSARVLGSLLLGSIVLLFVGCGRGPKTYPVTGVVTVGGRPVKDASVMFYRKDSPAVSAQTQADGSFQLRAVAGEHQVAITACESSGPMLDPLAVEDAAKLKWIVPQRYSKLDQTDQTAKVQAGQENRFKFDLPAK
jgi:hypothetical protein